MVVMVATNRLVPIKFNEEELAAADWLKIKTRRTRSGAVKWAVAEKAEELGYVPTKTSKPGPKKKGSKVLA